MSVMAEAINYFIEAGGIVVAAAGNDNSGGTNKYPSCYDGVISVAALDNAGVRSSTSNYGPCIDMSAPGVNIASTYKNSGYVLQCSRRRGRSPRPHTQGIIERPASKSAARWGLPPTTAPTGMSSAVTPA